MNVEYPTDEVPATPEYVLELFQNVFRSWDEPIDFPTFHTSVSEFAGAWNDTILFWWELAKPLNQFTGLNLPITEWKAVLYPMRERTVRDLCAFVAARMKTRPVIRSWGHICGNCFPAGAFLTMRSMLAESGIDVTQLRPSTRLDEFAFDTWEAIFCRLIRSKPGMQISPNWGFTISYYALSCLSLGLLILSLLAFPLAILIVLADLLPGILALVVLLGCLLGAYSTYRHTQRPAYRWVAWGDLLTFRDLSYTLAGQEPRRRIKPSS
jgi:hypothetical protein